MKPETFTEILETYGSKPEDWPEASRAACQRLVAQDAHAKGLLDQFERLAVGLDSLEPPSFEGLEKRIADQSLPPKRQELIESLIHWLLPQSSPTQMLWRLGITACLPLVSGMIIGTLNQSDLINIDDSYAYWEDELIMLSLNDLSEGLDTP
jgi:hypothetical protein